tara:strand:+ start:248 stop:544 length:297 start_codon:yes stop_codon:yes gene_type:complete
MKPNFIDAVRALVPNAQLVFSETEIMQWHSKEPQPSQEDIDLKLKELIADYDAKKYQRDRNYPDLGEQLDMIYWDKKNGTKKWEEIIDKVKADNPKPE